MTPQQLLIPRYEVIAPWPWMPRQIKVSDILETTCYEKDIYALVTDDGGVVINPQNYPANLRPLPWYHGRKIEEMPGYVWHKDKVLHVFYSKNMDGSLFLHAEDISFSVGNHYYPITPALESDYITFKNREK